MSDEVENGDAFVFPFAMDIHPVHDSPDALNAFLEWFKSQPGAFFSPDIRIADLAAYGRGRGILATSDIPAHTRLFVVPRRRVLSVETSDVVRKIPHVFHGGKAESTASSTDDEAEFDELANPGLELILILIYEYLHHATSPWRPYLDALPDEFDALMYWDALELRELQASAVIEKIGRDDAEQMFHEKLLPLINDHADIFYPVGTPAWSDEDLVKLAHRMGSIVTAYAFDLEREDEDDAEFEDGWIPDLDGLMSLGLVPMADMLNADGEFNVGCGRGWGDSCD
jgi:SET domain-containing protein 6